MHCLALRFPFLSLEALGVDIDKDSTITVSPRNKVVAATPTCIKEGVELGMSASTAALILNCNSVARERNKEISLLTKVCDALYAFTPYIQVYCPNEKDELAEQGLLLELTRSIRLFNGLEHLVRKIISAVNDLELTFFAALGQSGKAAWLLSYQETESNTGPNIQANRQPHEESTKPRIERIRISQLAEFRKEAEILEQTGFCTVGDLQQQIESEGLFSLQKRFKPSFIAYLKDILGDQLPILPEDHKKNNQAELFSTATVHTPLVVYEPETHFIESIECDFPLSSIELMHEPMKVLLQRLCSYLVRSQQQCSGITWRFSDIYQNEEILIVRSERIYRDWQLLYELSLIQLEGMGLPFEIDQVELREPLLALVHFDEGRLDNNAQKAMTTDKNIQRITAKMQARVGENNVFKVSVNDEHIPELSYQKVGVDQKVNDVLPDESTHVERPSWLLNSPVSIGVNQNDLYWHGRIQLIRGPEKIAAHWWDNPIDRDYFTAVREDHVRLWVFHDSLKNEWCVQGVF